MVAYGEGAYDCTAHGRVRPGPRDPSDLAAGRFEPRCPRCAQPLTTATVSEDAPLDPRNAYATSKVAQEHLAASWARMTGGAAVALRYHNVYGPGMPRDTPYSGVAAIFRSCLENGVAPRVFEDGGQRRDFIHVRDVARANLLALDAADEAVTGASPADGAATGGLRCYNVASGEPHTVGEMAAELGRRVRRYRTSRDRGVPARGRQAHRGLPARGRPRPGLPRADPLRRGHGRVRPRSPP